MIILEKMSVKFPELNMVADWRNDSMIYLRSINFTAKDQAQSDWVKSFGPSEAYYFIYEESVHQEMPEFKFKHFVGYCGLDKIHPVNRTAEIGLLIAPDKQGSRYGSMAVAELLRIGFEMFNLNCIFAEVIGTTDNHIFWSKQGFEIEGTLSERHFKDGKIHPSKMMSVLKSEWEKNNG